MLDNKYGKQIQIILQSTLTNYTTMLAMIIFYAYQFKVIISNVKERIFPTKRVYRIFSVKGVTFIQTMI